MKYIQMGFLKACLTKWVNGQKEYGKDFVGHPLEHLLEELVDAWNYTCEAEHQKMMNHDAADEMRTTIEIMASNVKDLYERLEKPADVLKGYPADNTCINKGLAEDSAFKWFCSCSVCQRQLCQQLRHATNDSSGQGQIPGTNHSW